MIKSTRKLAKLTKVIFTAASTSALLLAATPAQAYTMVILTNQPSTAKAQEIRAMLGTIAPFKHLKPGEFKVEIQSIDTDREGIRCSSLSVKMSDQERESLKVWSKANRICLSDAEIKAYKTGYTIKRNIDCDRPKLASIGARYGADATLFVLDHEGSGGSGGDVPILYTGSSTTVAIHEYLHSFGMADEYAYGRSEAPAFCRQPTWPNVGIFEERGPYRDNADIIRQHGSQIAWLTELGANPDLSHQGKLGTSYFGQLGLYPSKTCDQISMKSWKATPFPTIMEDVYTKWIPKTMWRTILKGVHVSTARLAEIMKKPEDTMKDRLLVRPKIEVKKVIFASGTKPKC